jgi:hypothetical protein
MPNIRPAKRSTMRRFKDKIGVVEGQTFCQVLREIYYHEYSNKQIRGKSRYAVGLAKNIVSRLRRYKKISGGEIKIMPMRKHKPVSIKKIEKTRYQGHHTICQFLRDIYAITKNEEIRMKCRIGMSMAKSMHERLKKYRKMMNAKEITATEGDLKQYDEEG